MLNSITISGRVVRDPELRRTGSGLAVTSFTVAVERDIPDSSTGKRETDWFDCVAWREKAEFVGKYFRKGSGITVKGRMQQREWTDKQGNKRKNWDLQADAIYFAGSRKDEEGQGGSSQQAGQSSYGGYGYPGGQSQSGGYGGYNNTYGPPQNPAGDFAMLEDDDAQLPF